jgi:hypothetical protein
MAQRQLLQICLLDASRQSSSDIDWNIDKSLPDPNGASDLLLLLPGLPPDTPAAAAAAVGGDSP